MKIGGLIVVIVLAFIGFIPARKAYWDYQVSEMCKKDGGLRVFEQAEISTGERELFTVAPGLYAIRVAEHSGDAPVVRRIVQATIREWNPQVQRMEQSAVRRSDGKLLAVHVDYSRVGGDLPSFAHPSSFSCPGGPALRIEDVLLFKD